MGAPIRRAVLTSSHIEYVGGSSVFWMAARYGRSQTSAMLDQPPNVDGYRRLFPGLGRRVRRRVHDPARSPTPSTSPPGSTTGVCAVPSAGQMAQNLVLLVPSADVLFAGAMCSFGTTPNAFDGDPGGAGPTRSATSATWPPPSSPASARSAAPTTCSPCRPTCGRASTPRATRTASPRARGTSGPIAHLDEINIERAAMLARGDDGVPPSMLRAHRPGLTPRPGLIAAAPV